MTLPGPFFTYEDYKLLPDDKRYEIIEGELLVTPTPTVRHQNILAELNLQLRSFAKAGGHGLVVVAPTDVILSNENVVQPDLLFIARERLGIANWSGGVHGAPDLVVEILSPSTSGRDQVVKRKLYGKFGVREYWIVDPTGLTIEVLTLGSAGLDTWQVFATGSSVTSQVLPGLQVPVADIFAE